mgnify:CR=1 FL=1
MVYEERTYRKKYDRQRFIRFQVIVEETDLDIAIDKESYTEQMPELVRECVQDLRKKILQYMEKDPELLTALVPREPIVDAPPQIVSICQAAEAAGVGPMAAIAGLFAEEIGRLLSRQAKDVIVENGGDIWIKTKVQIKTGIYAGNSPFSGEIALLIEADETPLSICTSSGTVGHSLSFGRADAMVVVSASAVLADAVATAAGNRVKTIADLEKAVDFALSVPGISGALAILGEKMAAKGKIILTSTE